MFCVSRCLLHVCCVMSHKTISCECEGESLLHVIRSERWEMWLLWREGARWMTQDVDITHHRIPVLHYPHLHVTHYRLILVSDVLHCRLSSDGHMSLGSQAAHSPMFPDSVSRSDCLPSLVFSAPAQLSRSQATCQPGQAATPGQGETLITARTMKLSAGRPGPGSRKTRRHSLTWCFDLIEA